MGGGWCTPPHSEDGANGEHRNPRRSTIDTRSVSVSPSRGPASRFWLQSHQSLEARSHQSRIGYRGRTIMKMPIRKSPFPISSRSLAIRQISNSYMSCVECVLLREHPNRRDGRKRRWRGQRLAGSMPASCARAKPAAAVASPVHAQSEQAEDKEKTERRQRRGDEDERRLGADAVCRALGRQFSQCKARQRAR